MVALHLLRVIALPSAMTLTNDPIRSSNYIAVYLNAGTKRSAKHHAPRRVSDLVYMDRVCICVHINECICVYMNA